MNSFIVGILLVSTNVYTIEDGDHIRKCTYTTLLLGERITCYKCDRGQYFIGPCSRDGGNSDCKPCPDGRYNTHCTKATSCANCDMECRDPDREKVYRNCTSEANLSCICKDGLYRDGSSICTPHGICPPEEGVTRIGNPYNNTVCEICLEGYYSGIASKTEGCKQCTKCSANETVLQECTSTNNTICIPKEKEKPKKGNPYNTTVREICLEGYYSGIASKTEGCKRCTKCSANEKVLQECTSTNNTICTLKEKEKPKKGWIIVVCVVGLILLGIVGAIVCIFYCSKRDIKNKSKPSTSDSGQVDKEQPGENGKGQDVEKKPLIKDNPDGEPNGKHSNGVVPQNRQEEGDTDEIRIEMDDNNTANGISEVQYQKMKKRQSTVKAQGTQTSEEENCRNEIDSGDLGVIMRGSGNADARQPRENDKEGDANKYTHEKDKDKVNSDNVVNLQEMKKCRSKNIEKATKPLEGVKNSVSATSGNTDMERY